MSAEVRLRQSSRLLRYGAAVLAVGAAILLRMALTPLIGPTAVPFITFFPAVLLVSWFGGFRPGALAILLSVPASDYLFMEPRHTFLTFNRVDQIMLIVFVVVGFGMALLSESQRRAVERAGRAESAERVERQRFETTLASIGDAVIATDAAGNVTFANRVALALLRWPEDKIRGRHLDEVFPIVNEYSRAAVESPVAKVLREGSVVGLANHTILIARDGSEVPIDDSAAPIRNAAGDLAGTVLVFRDMTERRRAERTSQHLAAIVESSDDAILSKDLNGIITSWNEGAERIFGYTAGEVIGQPVAILAAPDRRDEMPDILERIRRGERVDHYETVRRTKSGSLIEVSVTISPVRDAGGHIVGASKILRDVSAQARAQREIAEQRERLRVTLSSIGDAVLAADTAGRVSYLNPVAEQLTGWTAVEAVGQPLENVFRIINEDSRETAENPVARALREGRAVGLANHTVLISRDGREIFIDDSAAPIRNAGGAIIGVVLVFRDITAKRAAERMLAEQQAELRRRAELMDRAQLCVRDLEDRIVYWNRGAAELYGFSAQDAGGQVCHSLLQTEFPGPVEAIRAQFLAAGEWHGELVQTKRDGSQIRVDSHWTLHRDEHGRPIAILEMNTDITERQQAEQALRRERERLSMALTAGRMGAYEQRQNDPVRWWSPETYELMGVQRGRFTPTQEAVLALVHPEDRELLARRFKESVAQHQPFVHEFRILRPDGTVRWAGAWGRTEYEPEGWRHFGVTMDITDRKAAEEALRASEERLATIMQHLPIGVGVIDTAGRLVIGNPAWKRFLPGELPSLDDEENKRWRAAADTPPLARDDYPGMRALRGEEVLPGLDFLRQDDGGLERWTRIGAVPLRDAGSGRIAGALILLQDIDEERRAEQQRMELAAKERALASERALRETEAELARVVRALSVGELATSIAHEVNQPLAGVVTNAAAGLRWLGREPPNVEEARQSLALIARDGNRASEVIRRIREFLKKESPQRASLHLNEVIFEAVALARGELQKRQVEIHTEVASELAPVRGDRIQLQQVVLNLIMNGAEAMADSEARKALAVSARSSAEGSVLVAVRDAGAGIRREELARMFAPFFTTKAGGMGMGLSISRSIVEAHGGRIWAEANDGPGLTVQFTLPAESTGKTTAAGSEPS